MKKKILTLLQEQKKTFSTVESCTGGGLAKDFVLLPGASDVFRGSLVAYQDHTKIHKLGVAPEIIAQHSAVSQNCAEAMAIQGRLFFSSDYCLITTGYAGPGGGTSADPVGTVYFAVRGQKLQVVERRTFKGSNDRAFVIESAIEHAWKLFYKALSSKQI